MSHPDFFWVHRFLKVSVFSGNHIRMDIRGYQIRIRKVKSHEQAMLDIRCLWRDTCVF